MVKSIEKYEWLNKFYNLRNNVNPMVNLPIPMDVEQFLKENNFELHNEVGGGVSYYLWDLYVSKEHQLIVVPNNMYDDESLRYEVYTFKQYDEDDMVIENVWSPSEEYPTFLPYLNFRMNNNQ
jgi:hypothetical protein